MHANTRSEALVGLLMGGGGSHRHTSNLRNGIVPCHYKSSYVSHAIFKSHVYFKKYPMSCHLFLFSCHYRPHDECLFSETAVSPCQFKHHGPYLSVLTATTLIQTLTAVFPFSFFSPLFSFFLFVGRSRVAVILTSIKSMSRRGTTTAVWEISVDTHPEPTLGHVCLNPSARGAPQTVGQTPFSASCFLVDFTGSRQERNSNSDNGVLRRYEYSQDAPIHLIQRYNDNGQSMNGESLLLEIHM